MDQDPDQIDMMDSQDVRSELRRLVAEHIKDTATIARLQREVEVAGEKLADLTTGRDNAMRARDKAEEQLRAARESGARKDEALLAADVCLRAALDHVGAEAGKPAEFLSQRLRRFIDIVNAALSPVAETAQKGLTMKYRKKPVVIEAVQWTGSNLREVIDFTGLHPSANKWTWQEYTEVVRVSGLKIFTLEGPLMAAIGDWIIKGIRGEFYPCKPDIFAATYEPVEVAETGAPNLHGLLAARAILSAETGTTNHG